VFYPVIKGTAADGKTFPLIVYAHGDDSGDPGAHYKPLFEGLNSFGYIVAAARACNTGCKDDHANLPLDPGGFGHYYKEQLKVIQYAKQQANLSDAIFSQVNLTNGVGIAGHSMGGQSTVFASSYANATQNGITAAVMHHAYTHSYPAPTIPFLAMTGTSDLIASHKMTENYYHAQDACPTKGLVNKIGATHSEPDVEAFNEYLPQFTAAWFKIHLDKMPNDFGIDFDNMIYGTDSSSLCNGGDGNMKECELHR
jgi:alpha-beta hydrolase superfamily lysophospholipase